ncbi:hypothetical protein Acj9p194 [Acinetobacter phage Acj9]|uniref:Uncharacterized protein n=1 Tax=Acinetobacter phage Acj9 TaxID=760939 RepID=E5EPX8_9CAUD|nr:hypothetical protein Acj9p194 [Acinetobacter phage Acj9]ADG60094.1 hypothetical protein Acj9p194 [Acinetobacter phage Acj9]
MKLKSILTKVVKLALPTREAHKTDVMKKCGCPCHEGQPWISHFVPCCKYTRTTTQKIGLRPYFAVYFAAMI